MGGGGTRPGQGALVDYANWPPAPVSYPANGGGIGGYVSIVEGGGIYWSTAEFWILIWYIWEFIQII